MARLEQTRDAARELEARRLAVLIPVITDHMILRVDLVADSHGRWKRPLPSNSPHDLMYIESGAGGLTRDVETPLAFKQPT